MVEPRSLERRPEPLRMLAQVRARWRSLREARRASECHR